MLQAGSEGPALVQQLVLGAAHVAAAAQGAGVQLPQLQPGPGPGWLPMLDAQAHSAGAAVALFKARVLPALVGCAAAGPPSPAMLKVGFSQFWYGALQAR